MNSAVLVSSYVFGWVLGAALWWVLELAERLRIEREHREWLSDHRAYRQKFNSTRPFPRVTKLVDWQEKAGVSLEEPNK